MIGIGMTLTLRDFRQVAVYPKGMIVGTFAQILLMPVVAFGLAYLFGVSPAIAVGLVIIAACPVGTTSNLFVLLAWGNIALFIFLTVSASLSLTLPLPWCPSLALLHLSDTEEDVSLPVRQTIVMRVVIVLLPVAIGTLLRTRKPQPSRKAECVVSIFG